MYYGNNPFNFAYGSFPGAASPFGHSYGMMPGQGGIHPMMWNQPMSFASPWNFSAGFTSPWSAPHAFGSTFSPSPYYPANLSTHGMYPQAIQPHGALWNETHLLSQKLDLLHQQIMHLTELAGHNATFIASLMTGLTGAGAFGHQIPRYLAPVSPWTPGMNTPHGFLPPFPGVQGGTQSFGSGTPGPIGMSYEMSPIRIRETESYLCWEIPFQGLTLSDVEVEVIGNRIVCRTRAAIPPMQRFWNWSVLPSGIQVFELPDGRVECSCVVPVAFDAKEVEAVFKEGGIAIYVPKSGATERQNVRVGKDTPQYVTGGSSSRKNITASQHS